MIKIAQESCENKTWFQEHKLMLNLQRITNDMYECRGRIQGDFPIYIPNDSLLAEKIVQEAHIRTIHGGLGLTMGEVRKYYWVPKLRGLAKKIRSNCFVCKRFQITAFANPPPGALSLDRKVGNRALWYNQKGKGIHLIDLMQFDQSNSFAAVKRTDHRRIHRIA